MAWFALNQSLSRHSENIAINISATLNLISVLNRKYFDRTPLIFICSVRLQFSPDMKIFHKKKEFFKQFGQYLLYYGNAEYICTYYDKMLNEETLFLTCHGQAFLLDSMPLIMRPCLEVVVNNANLGCLWLAKPSLRPQNGCIIFIGIDWPISLAVKTNPPWEILLKGWEFMVAL